MGSIFRLNSSSDYINANYFDSNDSNVYVHTLTHAAAGGSNSTTARWEYTAVIGENQPFKELEVSSGSVVIRGEKLAELAGDLRPTITTTTKPFYSLRVNNEGRCYVRSSIAGDCLHGSKLNAFFDWSKYGVVRETAATETMTAGEEKWKAIAEARRRELEVCELKLKELNIINNGDDDKSSGEEKRKGELADNGDEEGWEVCSGLRRPGCMDYSAVLVVVFYVVGLYYWGAKLLSILFRKRS